MCMTGVSYECYPKQLSGSEYDTRALILSPVSLSPFSSLATEHKGMISNTELHVCVHVSVCMRERERERERERANHNISINPCLW